MNEGFPEIGEQNGWADTACVPDLDTLRRAAHLDRVALVLGDLWWSPERRVEVSPRNVLRAPGASARAPPAYTPWAAVEYEFFVFADTFEAGPREGVPQPRAGAPHADRLLHLPRRPRRGAARRAVADVRRERHPGRVDEERDGPRPVRDHVRADRRPGGRRPRRAGASCSRARSPRSAAARRRSWRASRPPAWARPGTSTCRSPGAGGENLFDPDGKGLSQVGRQFIGGIMRRAPEFMVLACPYMNSYKRLDPANFVTASLDFGAEGRTTPVPRLRARPVAQRRVPHPRRRRQPVPGAGGDGGGRAWRASRPAPSRSRPAPRRRRRSATCPTTCATRSTAGQSSEWARATFGDLVVDMLGVEQRHELAVFAREISDIELRRGFEWV